MTACPPPDYSPAPLGPLSGSPHAVVAAALRLAELSDRDTLLDVGCNDGRVLVAAARLYSCRCLGLELDGNACERARAASLGDGVSHLVDIVQCDALSVSWSSATVVFLYLLPRGNQLCAEKLLVDLRPGCRVVTHMFRMPPSWDGGLVRSESVSSCRPGGVDTSAFCKLFLYVM